ncbi:hypothetical protein Hypma_006043 [Hypsizygus marmoreus]|uniref:Uncharacterized protein n=1 Tax=Hypsizygus marmoreus TaxID=39966 RepID=A0A369JVT8_HYPMA|nr:hypothetical protein Hypma_006043 [Hypsizygus marmoreus]
MALPDTEEQSRLASRNTFLAPLRLVGCVAVTFFSWALPPSLRPISMLGYFPQILAAAASGNPAFLASLMTLPLVGVAFDIQPITLTDPTPDSPKYVVVQYSQILAPAASGNTRYLSLRASHSIRQTLVVIVFIAERCVAPRYSGPFLTPSPQNLA